MSWQSIDLTQEPMSWNTHLPLYSCHGVFIDRFIFRSSFSRKTLPWECHDQLQETNWRHYVTGSELPFCISLCKPLKTIFGWMFFAFFLADVHSVMVLAECHAFRSFVSVTPFVYVWTNHSASCIGFPSNYPLDFFLWTNQNARNGHVIWALDQSERSFLLSINQKPEKKLRYSRTYHY